jgi:hypothetical protein
MTTNKGLNQPANGSNVDTWDVPVNNNFGWIDQAFGSTTGLNATSGSATLVDTQYRSLALAVTGAIAANVTYTIPTSVGGQWIVYNTTTDSAGGPWTVTFVSGGGGTSVTVERGYVSGIYSDGTNVRYSDSRPIAPATNSVTTASIQNGAVTYAKVDTASIATAADFRANTASHLLDTTGVWSSGALVALTDASSIVVDMSTGLNFSLTLGASRTLASPTNAKVGQSGLIVVTNPAAYTLAFGGNYKFAGGAAPTITTTGTTALSYFVVTTSYILVVAILGVA